MCIRDRPYLAFGPGAALANWVSGIPFDIAHCAGNFLTTLLLYTPLVKGLSLLQRQGGGAATDGDRPVSYTHLDVYKRQPLLGKASDAGAPGRGEQAASPLRRLKGMLSPAHPVQCRTDLPHRQVFGSGRTRCLSFHTPSKKRGGESLSGRPRPRGHLPEKGLPAAKGRVLCTL